MFRNRVVAVCIGLAIAAGSSSFVTQAFAADEGRGAASQGDAAEKAAFESAKALGSAEAWQAFLAHYPKGFHADLARAYMKQLGGPAPVAAPLEAKSCYVTRVSYRGGDFRLTGPGKWVESSGSTRFRFDEQSRSATQIHLNDDSRGVNIYTDLADRIIWYEDAGAPRRKLYDIVDTGCETAEPAGATLPAPAYQKPAAAPRYVAPPKKAVSTACAAGKILVNGRCMRRADAIAHCGPGYRPQGGKCVPGYRAPKPSDGLSTEQRKAVGKGCPRGQVWNAQEGCHEDD